MRAQTFVPRLTRLTVPLAAAAALTAAVGLAGGCKKEQVRAYEAPKEPPRAAVAAAQKSPGANMRGHAAIDWTLPDGWKQVVSMERMRFATISVADNQPGTELTITRLPKSPPLANINRWAGQIGRAPITDAELEDVFVEAETGAGKAGFVDLRGPEGGTGGRPQQRLLVAVVPDGPFFWFVKLTGPATVVEAQRAKFDAFLKSLHFDDEPHAGSASAGAGSIPGEGVLPDGHPPIGGQAVGPVVGPTLPGPSQTSGAGATPSPPGGAGDIARWQTPAGWQGRAPDSVRKLSFATPGGAEMVVTAFGGPFVEKPNVDRWRGQVGLPPEPTVNASSVETVKVSGLPGKVYDFPGPEQRIVVAAVPRGAEIWYFKLTGPSAAVAAQRDAFKAFLASVEFEK